MNNNISKNKDHNIFDRVTGNSICCKYCSNSSPHVLFSTDIKFGDWNFTSKFHREHIFNKSYGKISKRIINKSFDTDPAYFDPCKSDFRRYSDIPKFGHHKFSPIFWNTDNFSKMKDKIDNFYKTDEEMLLLDKEAVNCGLIKTNNLNVLSMSNKRYKGVSYKIKKGIISLSGNKKAVSKLKENVVDPMDSAGAIISYESGFYSSSGNCKIYESSFSDPPEDYEHTREFILIYNGTKHRPSIDDTDTSLNKFISEGNLPITIPRYMFSRIISFMRADFHNIGSPVGTMIKEGSLRYSTWSDYLSKRTCRNLFIKVVTDNDGLKLTNDYKGLQSQKINIYFLKEGTYTITATIKIKAKYKSSYLTAHSCDRYDYISSYSGLDIFANNSIEVDKPLKSRKFISGPIYKIIKICKFNNCEECKNAGKCVNCNSCDEGIVECKNCTDCNKLERGYFIRTYTSFLTGISIPYDDMDMDPNSINCIFPKYRAVIQHSEESELAYKGIEGEIIDVSLDVYCDFYQSAFTYSSCNEVNSPRIPRQCVYTLRDIKFIGKVPELNDDYLLPLSSSHEFCKTKMTEFLRASKSLRYCDISERNMLIYLRVYLMSAALTLSQPRLFEVVSYHDRMRELLEKRSKAIEFHKYKDVVFSITNPFANVDEKRVSFFGMCSPSPSFSCKMSYPLLGRYRNIQNRIPISIYCFVDKNICTKYYDENIGTVVITLSEFIVKLFKKTNKKLHSNILEADNNKIIFSRNEKGYMRIYLKITYIGKTGNLSIELEDTKTTNISMTDCTSLKESSCVKEISITAVVSSSNVDVFSAVLNIDSLDELLIIGIKMEYEQSINNIFRDFDE